jgi:hypothetical protein
MHIGHYSAEDIRRAQGRFSKKDIIDTCKLEIKKHGQIKIYEYFHFNSWSELERAIAILKSTGKYVLDHNAEGQQYLRKAEPKSNLKHDLKLALITGVITLAVGLILWLVDNKSRQNEIQELKDRINNIENHK